MTKKSLKEIEKKIIIRKISQTSSFSVNYFALGTVRYGQGTKFGPHNLFENLKLLTHDTYLNIKK